MYKMKDNLSTQETNIIFKLSKYFFRGIHQFNLSNLDVNTLSYDVQENLLNLTIKNPVVQRYPVSNEFCRLYFKNILKFIETNQEVHEGIYEFLCHSMSQTHNTFCYRHYVIGHNFNNLITMKETKNMVINGTTGMKTWEAALLLTDWMLTNKNVFENMNILELGSGVGFTGITIAKLCNISRITLTDCHADVLNSIKENICINFTNLEEIENHESLEYFVNKKVIRVKELDWNDTEKIQLEDIPDIIIGADIVYDPCILEPLCLVLQSFFERKGSINAYIACVVRNEDTFNKFLQSLALHNMNAEKLEVTECTYIDWEPNLNKCIVKINSVIYK